MKMSAHAERRSKARAIRPEVIEQLMEYGREYHAGNGCLAYFVGRRLEDLEERPELAICRNKAVIVYGERVVTVHHCEHPPRSWRRAG